MDFNKNLAQYSWRMNLSTDKFLSWSVTVGYCSEENHVEIYMLSRYRMFSKLVELIVE